MPIITIRGQMGSGAPEIGKILANRLHIDYIDREIIAEVAANLKRKPTDVAQKETPPISLIERIGEALSYSYPIVTSPEGTHIPVYVPVWEVPLDDERYFKSLELVIKKLAESQSIVIRGRGSQFILKDLPEALHVLIVAASKIRLKRIVESLKVTETQAQKEINRSDNSHREFIKRYFKQDLEDPVNYDIVVNTSIINFRDAAAIINRALQLKLKITQIQNR
jgi:cytidylate kinase